MPCQVLKCTVQGNWHLINFILRQKLAHTQDEGFKTPYGVAYRVKSLKMLVTLCISGIYVNIFSSTTSLQGLNKMYRLIYQKFFAQSSGCITQFVVLTDNKKNTPRKVHLIKLPFHEQTGFYNWILLQLFLGSPVCIPETI